MRSILPSRASPSALVSPRARPTWRTMLERLAPVRLGRQQLRQAGQRMLLVERIMKASSLAIAFAAPGSGA